MRDTAGVLDGLIGVDQTAHGSSDEVGRDPGRLRIGLCTQAFTGADVDEGCVQAARDAAALMEGLGHPSRRRGPPPSYDPDLLGGADEIGGRANRQSRSTNGRRTRPSARRRRRRADHVEAGLDGTSAVRGRRGRVHSSDKQQLTRGIREWWHGFDLLLTPTTAEPGPPLGAYKQGFAPGRGSAFTRVFNATGQPAVSLPLGWPEDGLPRGVQLVAAYGRDDLLIRVGSQLEGAAPWFDRRPPLA